MTIDIEKELETRLARTREQREQLEREERQLQKALNAYNGAVPKKRRRRSVKGD
jgi:hypothetical protein